MRRRVLARAATAVIAVALAPLMVVQPAGAAASADGAWLRNDSSSALCLDGSASQGVRMNTCHTGSRYQQWTQAWIGTDTFELKNAGNFSMCLDGSISSGARMLPCNGKDYQLWKRGPQAQLWNDAYDSYRSLDGSVSQGVRMNVTSASYNRYQTWYFTAR